MKDRRLIDRLREISRYKLGAWMDESRLRSITENLWNHSASKPETSTGVIWEMTRGEALIIVMELAEKNRIHHNESEPDLVSIRDEQDEAFNLLETNPIQ